MNDDDRRCSWCGQLTCRYRYRCRCRFGGVGGTGVYSVDSLLVFVSVIDRLFVVVADGVGVGLCKGAMVSVVVADSAGLAGL